RLLRHREDREDVAVGMIVRRRAWTAIPRLSEIRSCLQRANRKLARSRIAGIERQFGHIGRDVDDQPVPEAAAGRRVWIEACYGEAFGAGRCTRPGQMRRLVAAGAAEAEITRQDVRGGKIISIAKALAAECKRHCIAPLASPEKLPMPAFPIRPP